MSDKQNTKRIEETLQGTEIAKLNELSPGLGNKLHRMFSGLGNVQSAQAGHKGSVGIKKQKRINPQGITDAAIVLERDRIAGVDDPIDDLDAVNLRTLRRLRQELVEDDPQAGSKQKEACRPVALSNMKTIETGMTATYAVEVLNELAYVAGEATGTPAFEVYRIFGQNEFVLIGSVTTSEIFQRMVLHGQYVFGCRNGSNSNNLTVIDLTKPDNPTEIALFNMGAAGKGLHAQGGFVHVACDGSIKIVDVSVPSAPIVTASI